MIDTTNIKTGGSTPKFIQPGNIVAKILSIKLEDFKFRPGAQHIVLLLEGEDLGEGFEGLSIDKNNASLGKHKGQIGNVKAGQYAFEDATPKPGIVINKQAEILKFMKNLCVALDVDKWLTDQNGKCATIQDLIDNFNTDKPYADKYISWCICGKEYQSKTGGHTNYELYLPKYSTKGAPFDSIKLNHVAKFDPSTHIQKSKTKPVAEFGNNEVPGTSAPDFTL